MNRSGYEINFDGIVGPTHNYSGLSYGNTASMASQQEVSSPREAALQGLEKMRLLTSLGIKQAVIPPQERPLTPLLRELGYNGSDSEILANVAQKEPELLYAVSSAASMWTANAATVSPSADTIDKHIHITPANLIANFHRFLEVPTTQRILEGIFRDPLYFTIHPPLPSSPAFGDEGAANHTRFCKDYHLPGIELFTFGRYGLKENLMAPKLYPARQTYEAGRAIVRNHGLYPERVLFVQQNPRAIDTGVFHNDVIAVGNQNVLFYHEAAFIGGEPLLDEATHKIADYCDTTLCLIKVPEKRISLAKAVSTYLFNSQLVTQSEGNMLLIAPAECREDPLVNDYLNEIVAIYDNPIKAVHYANLRESMRNGGGPACLRLRVAVSDNELAAINPDVMLTDRLYEKLKAWITTHYRDRLTPKDLGDPKLLEETHEAMNQLTKILNLGNIYSFQT